MMLKVYLDTNVILEHALQRKNYKEVVEVFHLAEVGALGCYTSAATFFTIAFFLQKVDNNKQVFKNYFSFVKVVSTLNEDLRLAVNSSFMDIEDGFQYYSALGKCDYFLTFNTKDFLKHQDESLPCMRSSEFLERFQ